MSARHRQAARMRHQADLIRRQMDIEGREILDGLTTTALAVADALIYDKLRCVGSLSSAQLEAIERVKR